MNPSDPTQSSGHICLTADNEWVACPPDLCEAASLWRENRRLNMVPCDAAAVERVAREMSTWSGPVPIGPEGFRPFAERALRAAGETS